MANVLIQPSFRNAQVVLPSRMRHTAPVERSGRRPSGSSWHPDGNRNSLFPFGNT